MTDARSGWQELQRRLPGRRLIIVGESLGREAYPWLPVAALLRDALRADLAAPRVQAPVNRR